MENGLMHRVAKLDAKEAPAHSRRLTRHGLFGGMTEGNVRARRVRQMMLGRVPETARGPDGGTGRGVGSNGIAEHGDGFVAASGQKMAEHGAASGRGYSVTSTGSATRRVRHGARRSREVRDDEASVPVRAERVRARGGLAGRRVGRSGRRTGHHEHGGALRRTWRYYVDSG